MTQVDHVQAAIATLPPRLRSGNYAKVIALLVRPLNELAQAIEDLSRAYSLSTSKAPLWLLRVIARRFGLDLPPGYSVEEYRVFIRAQAAATLSSGTWPQVYAVANLLRPASVPEASLAWVLRYPPDGLAVGIPGLPAKWAPVAKQILRQAVRAQDRVDLMSLPADFFTYDKGPGFDIGKLAKLL